MAAIPASITAQTPTQVLARMAWARQLGMPRPSRYLEGSTAGAAIWTRLALDHTCGRPLHPTGVIGAWAPTRGFGTKIMKCLGQVHTSSPIPTRVRAGALEPVPSTKVMEGRMPLVQEHTSGPCLRPRALGSLRRLGRTAASTISTPRMRQVRVRTARRAAWCTRTPQRASLSRGAPKTHGPRGAGSICTLSARTLGTTPLSAAGSLATVT
mmetsp:Transcript_5083/g.7061  ORF Transcript_5083/g.7061 Transcript_5083/m.7061 type:complete len:211 (-) Transcript_5083:152-784(-)